MIRAKTKEIVIARAEKGWNSTELAQVAGLSSSAICRIEKGRGVSAKAAKKIADALGKSVTQLFTFSD